MISIYFFFLLLWSGDEQLGDFERGTGRPEEGFKQEEPAAVCIYPLGWAGKLGAGNRRMLRRRDHRHVTDKNNVGIHVLPAAPPLF